MDSRVPLVAVGHLPIHFDSLIESLRPHFTLSVVRWRPAPRSILRSLFVVAWLLFRALKAVKEHDARIVLAQYAFPDGFVSTLAATLLRRHCIIQVVGSDIRQLPRGLKLSLIKWAVRRASAIICVSRDLEHRSRRLGARRTRVIPTPIDVSFFADRNEVVKHHRLVTVANLVPLKGIDILLRALHIGPQMELVVIGDGPEREKLEKLSKELRLEEHVRFTGFISQEKVAKYLCSSSMFVLPSLSEGLPRSVLEAMACGMFVIATKVGGIPDAVKDEENGLLVQPNDVTALSEAIRIALKNPLKLETVGKRNRVLVQRYDIEVVGLRISDFIRQTVALKRQ